LIKQLFNQLDDIWKITALDQLKFYLFQFEFCLRQLEQASSGSLTTQIKATIDKISATLNLPPRLDFSDYRTEWYTKISNENLIELFYAFDNSKVFKDLNNNQLETIEKVGFYFAKNEALFENVFLKSEKKRFLEKLNLLGLINLSYKDFLFTIFNKHIKSEIEFYDITISQNKEEYILSYKFGKSLSEFFTQNTINNNVVDIYNQGEEIRIKRTIFLSSEKLFNEFVNKLINKHRIQRESINKNFFSKFLKNLKGRRKVYRERKFNAAVENVFQHIGAFIRFLFREGVISFIVAALLCILLKDGIGKLFYPDIDRWYKPDNDPNYWLNANIFEALFKWILTGIWFIISLILFIPIGIIYVLNEIYLIAVSAGLLAAKMTRANTKP
jgi:hypothetical protein